MEIIRDGKRIELKEEELQEAFITYQKANDILTIENEMESFLNKQQLCEFKNNKKFIEEAVAIFRDDIDENNFCYTEAITDAFEGALSVFDKTEEKIYWFEKITDRLRDYSEGRSLDRRN